MLAAGGVKGFRGPSATFSGRAGVLVGWNKSSDGGGMAPGCVGVGLRGVVGIVAGTGLPESPAPGAHPPSPGLGATPTG
jgi:hypothetical protein